MPFPYCCQFEISQLLQGLSVRKHNSVGPVSLAGLDIKPLLVGAVVVAQLAEWLLPTPEVPVFG